MHYTFRNATNSTGHTQVTIQTLQELNPKCSKCWNITQKYTTTKINTKFKPNTFGEKHPK